MMVLRPPCPSCPWRVDQHAEAIPNFSLDLAEALAVTCAQAQDLDTPMFACHQSREGEEIVCASWLARYGRNSVRVRLASAMRSRQRRAIAAPLEMAAVR